MKVTLHLEGSREEIIEQTNEFLAYIAGQVAADAEDEEPAPTNEFLAYIAGQVAADAEDEEPAPKKRGAKVTTVDEDEDETVEGDDEDATEGDNSDDEEESEEPEESDGDEALSEKELAKLKAALRAYSSEHDKDKALKVLKKFAKTAAEVKPSDLPKLLKALKV